jgi:hypothetical protein
MSRHRADEASLPAEPLEALMEPGALDDDPALAEAVHDLDVMLIRLGALTRDARELIMRLETRRPASIAERAAYVGVALLGVGLVSYSVFVDQLHNVGLAVAGIGFIFFRPALRSKRWPRE